jgi:drug/metabolite transporter (DMT)-like permease
MASVVYLGALGTVVAFVAFSEGIRRIGAPRASAFIVLVPLLGEVLTFWLLGEEVGGLIVAGTAVVLAGLWLVQTARPPVRHAAVPPEPPLPPLPPVGSGS